jgi:hypothetical protein
VTVAEALDVTHEGERYCNLECERLARITAILGEYGNPSISLHRVVDAEAGPLLGRIVLDDSIETRTVETLDDADAARAVADPVGYLREIVSDWCADQDDPALCRQQWEIADYPEADPDATGGRILVTRDWLYGGCTYEYVTDEHGDVVYPTVADARAWIDEAEAERYCRQHNEAARPTYRIVAGR